MASLTQALSDGHYDYLYGVNRLAQVDRGTQGTEYFLGDALGSVRQLADETGNITFAQGYDPYGMVTQVGGDSQTAYGFTNEYTNQGLVYLRSRMYSPTSGRFLTRDLWQGDDDKPLSYNKWNYVEGNPVNRIDPYGNVPCANNSSYNVDLTGNWPALAADAVCSAVDSVGKKLSTIVGGGSPWAFNRIYRGVTFDWNKNCYGCRPSWCIENNKYGEGDIVPGTENTNCKPKGGFTSSAYSITFATLFLSPDEQHYISDTTTAEKLRNNVVHELGHAFDHKTYRLASSVLDSTQINLSSPCYISRFPNRVDLPEGDVTGPNFGFASQQGVLMWQKNSSGDPKEEFADMYLGWTFDTWGPPPDGIMRANWMAKYMPTLIRLALSYE